VDELSGRVVYENNWMRVHEDIVRSQDGSTGIYGVVDRPDFSLVLPRGAGGFWMVEQYRYPIRRRAWEFPQGSHEASHGDPQEVARVELSEETGLRADSFAHLGFLSEACGFSTSGFHVYLATGLTEGLPARELTESDMEHRFVSDGELSDMIGDGRLVDAASVAALYLYLVHRRAMG
jgi:8-oxo-dGTP pyrophosphatase MutT (NUDIX family)